MCCRTQGIPGTCEYTWYMRVHLAQSSTSGTGEYTWYMWVHLVVQYSRYRRVYIIQTSTSKYTRYSSTSGIGEYTRCPMALVGTPSSLVLLVRRVHLVQTSTPGTPWYWWVPLVHPVPHSTASTPGTGEYGEYRMY